MNSGVLYIRPNSVEPDAVVLTMTGIWICFYTHHKCENNQYIMRQGEQHLSPTHSLYTDIFEEP